MSVQTPVPDQAPLEQSSSRRSALHRSGTRSSRKPLRRLALAISALLLFFIGVAMGNGARKRIDRLTHGY